MVGLYDEYFKFPDLQYRLSWTLVAIGGGARSRLWLEILANVLGRPLLRVRGGEVGPALGAARLARLAVGDGNVDEVCREPAIEDAVEPQPHRVERYAETLEEFRALYANIRATRDDRARGAEES